MAAVKTKASGNKASAKKVSAKKAPAKKQAVAQEGPKKHRIFAMPFASIYPLYVQKAEKKGRTKQEVDEVIAWLTGYKGASLQRVLDAKTDLETFFVKAPRWSPNAARITGVVCGVRVEELADPLMQKVRYLDKLIDELAQGKAMAKILRQ